MAEAARTTRHYVSDSLAERYPYDAGKGFVGIRQRDAGRVFNGHGSSGVDDMMNSLADPSVPTDERTKAAHHLYARSASQETKVEMLNKGLVPLLVATIQRCPSLLLLHQCLLLLRSLAVLPQGCLALIRQGAVPVVTAALRTSLAAEGPAESPQTSCIAAAHVLCQVSGNASGLRWLLGVEHDAAFEGGDVAWVGEPMTPEALIAEVAAGIARSGTPTQAVAHLVQTLAHLTSLDRGVTAFLATPAAIDTVVVLLEQQPQPPKEDVETCAAVLEVLWNAALSPAGGAALEQREVPQVLMQMQASICGHASEVPTSVQRQLTGVLSAVSQLTSVKRASTGPVSPFDSRQCISMLVDSVREWNGLIHAQYTAAAKPVPRDAAAVVANLVQCVRLSSELKVTRDVTHAAIDAVEQENATEAFHFRRQLYFHTRWEAEYNASVEV